MKLTGEKVFLTSLTEEDVELIREWRNKYRDSFQDSGEISKEAQKAFYERYKETHTDQMFIIHDPKGEKIGTIALYGIDLSTRTAHLGRVLLLEEFRGHGYAEDAVKVMVKYAQERVRLFKLTVEVYLDNLDAIAIYSRAGFSHKRPIVILESRNENLDWNKPIRMEA